MENWCDACSTKVDFKNYKQAVMHYHGKKHKENREKKQTPPNDIEIEILKLTAEEVSIILAPINVREPDPPVIVPIQLYAQHGGKQWKIVADKGIVGKIRGL